MRRTTAKAAKDQKASSRAPVGKERNHVHVSSACLCAEQEDKGQKTTYHPCYPNREETNFDRACIKRHSGCWPPP
jgi:hypothetical protein